MSKLGTRVAAVLVSTAMLQACQQTTAVDPTTPVAGWDEPTGTKGGGQYSPLTQIDRSNVGRLKVAWTYESPDFAAEAGAKGSPHATSNVVVTPIIADGKLLTCTPLHRVIALDPRTGKELWSHDPKMDRAAVPSHFCRGVTTWQDPAPVPGKPCQRRVFSSTGDGRLIALDLTDGKLCPDFGAQGTVNMKEGLGPIGPNEYYNTTQPLVIGDLVISGHSIRDGFRTNIAGGVVRAWDARTGQLVWAWDPVGPKARPITPEAVAAGALYTRGTPNVWSFMSADVERGLIYLPTGNAQPDFVKGPTPRDIDHFGSSVVALEAKTGKVVWRFQTVVHDLWDYDVGAQPVLYEHRGQTPAVAVATKQGHIFLLNRLTGEPLFPIESRPVPQTDVPGEWTSPTQPFPTLPEPVLGHRITAEDMANTPILSTGCKALLESSRNEGVFTPPSLRGSLQNPGVAGGFNWGAGSINPQRGVYVATYINMPFIVQLVPRKDQRNPDDNRDPVDWFNSPQYETPYELVRIPFLSKRGVPCMKPPWGEIMAVDLSTGKTLWRKPLGSMRSRVPLVGNWFKLGVPVSGGTLQTASGLVFVAASADESLRAFDAQTGAEVWDYHLPFSAHSTPMTYRLAAGEKQYLVVATGGSLAMDAKVGDTLVAFTLPD